MTKKTFKGFDKNLKCKDFQYEIGKEYKIKDKPIKCTSYGFHSCENPFDVWNYYSPADSRFAECEIEGEKNMGDSDTKISSSEIKINAEINLIGIIKAGIEYIFRNINFGESEKESNDDSAKIGSSGNYAQIGSSGYSAQIKSEGINSIISAIGKKSTIKAKKDSWIVLAEFDEKGIVKSVKSGKIDGKILKEDTFYILKDGEFKEM